MAVQHCHWLHIKTVKKQRVP